MVAGQMLSVFAHLARLSPARIDYPAGTSIAVPQRRGLMMNLARVSAVCLLILGMGVCGLCGEADRRDSSSVRLKTEDGVGVGTERTEPGKRASGVPREATETEIKPLTVFREVEKGWHSGTPKSFERFLSKDKVRLDFGEGGPRGGFFTRSQAYYLLLDYMKLNTTVRVDILRAVEASGKVRPFALLELRERDRNGVSRDRTVMVSLSKESGAWMISEMRIVPAR
jgi:hypothetical protein